MKDELVLQTVRRSKDPTLCKIPIPHFFTVLHYFKAFNWYDEIFFQPKRGLQIIPSIVIIRFLRQIISSRVSEMANLSYNLSEDLKTYTE